MELEINIIDAFTDVAFKGNSAAVIITNDWLSDELMQSIAIENNLSETAYVKKIDIHNYEIRWFSPITEIDFCGHATLASSFVIFAKNDNLLNINFYAEAVGDLSVTKMDSGYIQMEFPSRPPESISDIPVALLNGLSIKPMEVLLNNQAYFVVYEKEIDVTSVVPDNELLKQLAPHDVVVTSKSNDYDFVSRYFWPANGGDEDPVTGSIHTGLAPYWAEKLNKSKLIAYQASKRGGKIICNVADNKVYLLGKAVQYLKGTIEV
ncbi:PhzF family phenazine biosynthesis protein [Colwellia sp. Bg11-28]|jgi:PhzF family phenazine biosynthesis protein|uniref:PhzF family phenazine biosynthesis protein n=1 Tax=Colwellia sp. Bg11-28 TaxID=2058305 RepID=UPI000C32A7BD|nr:PhzF family phenazine biosynthesis protein [Colwellia sp. Bg11-28]PKH87178.1 phenazine biosynthesis protein PhzF [Colwellia sp. Bg11-28]